MNRFAANHLKFGVGLNECSRANKVTGCTILNRITGYCNLEITQMVYTFPLFKLWKVYLSFECRILKRLWTWVKKNVNEKNVNRAYCVSGKSKCPVSQ